MAVADRQRRDHSKCKFLNGQYLREFAVFSTKLQKTFTKVSKSTFPQTWQCSYSTSTKKKISSDFSKEKKNNQFIVIFSYTWEELEKKIAIHFYPNHPKPNIINTSFCELV